MDRRTRICLENAEAELARHEPNARTGQVILRVLRIWIDDVFEPHAAAMRRHISDEVPEIQAQLQKQHDALWGTDERDGLMDLKRQICVASRWGAAVASVIGGLIGWALYVLNQVASLLEKVP